MGLKVTEEGLLHLYESTTTLLQLGKETSTDVGKVCLTFDVSKKEGVKLFIRLFSRVDSIKFQTNSSKNVISISFQNSQSNLSKNVEKFYENFYQNIHDTSGSSPNKGIRPTKGTQQLTDMDAKEFARKGKPDDYKHKEVKYCLLFVIIKRGDSQLSMLT